MKHSTDTTEKGFESHITQYLVEENQYLLRENKAYDNRFHPLKVSKLWKRRESK